MFNNISRISQSNADTGDMVRLISDLKKRAVKEDLDYTLNIDTISEIIWVTNEAMDPDELIISKEKGSKLSKEIDIINIEFKGYKAPQISEDKIKFKKNGYSDFALIHIKVANVYKTILIEPFISQIRLLESKDLTYDCT